MALVHAVPERKRSRFGWLRRIQLRSKPRPTLIVALTIEDEKANEEQVIDKYLMVTTSSFAIALTGAVVFPPLTILCLPGLIYTAIPVWKEAYHAVVKEHRFRMACVDAVAIPLSILTGYYVAVSLALSLFFVAKKLLLRTQDSSKQQLVNILGEQPRFVWVRSQDGAEVRLQFEQLQVNDIIIVEAGQMIAVDGVIAAGTATIDERMLTGESQPVEKQAGDRVLAATVVLQGCIDVRVETRGSETIAAQIGRIMSQTADFKSSVQLRGEALGDRAALPLLALSGLAWTAVAPVAGVVVLFSPVVDALRLASPLSVLGYLRKGLDKGILIKDGRALELLQEVDCIVFDKTGTLTEEQPQVGAIHLADAPSETALLRLAAAAEHKQTHPIAKAIKAEAEKRALELPAVEEAKYEIGFGLSVVIEQQLVQVGSQRFVESADIHIPEPIRVVQASCSRYGHGLVYVAVDGVLAGAIELLPTIRPEVPAIVDELHQRGLTTYIISGDREEPTRRLAQQLHIDHYFAETLPEDKATLIEQLQAEGHKVCFVGDGINDSIALKKANVPVSISGATHVATDTAQIIFMDGTLNHLTALFDLAAGLDKNMQRNVAASVVPTAIIIGGAFFFHLGMYAAIGLYNLSLITGVTNALSPSLKRNNALLPRLTRRGEM